MVTGRADENEKGGACSKEGDETPASCTRFSQPTVPILRVPEAP